MIRIRSFQLRELLKSNAMVPLIFVVGVIQYAAVAFNTIASSDVTLWQMDVETTDSAGVLRYVKDAYILGLSMTWPLVIHKLQLPQNLRKLIRFYFVWLSTVLIIGLLGFLLNFSPLFFLPAGLRWLLLLHAAFGVFILSSSLVSDRHSHIKIFWIVTLLLLVDGYVIVLQFVKVANLYSVAFGSVRLIGLFSNAGVAGFFVIAVAMVSSLLDGVKPNRRVALNIVCIFIALSSGTRFATMCIFFIVLMQLWEISKNGKGLLKKLVQLLFVPLCLFSVVTVYQAVNRQVDRGDAITQQMEKGGRVGNFFDTVEMLKTAETIEFLFGRGLGIGTNTAIGSIMAKDLDPGVHRFNLLVDNTFLTNFFQLGLVGSIVLWSGLLRFLWFAKPRYSAKAMNRYFVIVFVIAMAFALGNPFEQFFLIMSYAVSLGYVYWTDRETYLKLERSFT